MTETQRRSLLERVAGKPVWWLAWVWVGLALVWLAIAIVEPSGFHTFMASAWAILAAVQLGSVIHARRQERHRGQTTDSDSSVH